MIRPVYSFYSKIHLQKWNCFLETPTKLKEKEGSA